jgi:flagellar biosynthesis protein FlhA
VNSLLTMDNAVRWMTRLRGVLLPAAAAGGVLVIFVPLPAALMDVLLVGTVALSAIILLTTLYVASPLEFNLFPSVLLGATLLRLVLNVGLTRLILTAGADDSGEPHLAAGRVVWALGDLIGPGTLSVGLILLDRKSVG